MTDHKNHNISEVNGFWRSHGVGPVAMTKQTYLMSSGYNQNIHGWGNEDTELYDDFIKNGIQFVRSNDEGIFHPWHSKNCSGYKFRRRFYLAISDIVYLMIFTFWSFRSTIRDWAIRGLHQNK